MTYRSVKRREQIVSGKAVGQYVESLAAVASAGDHELAIDGHAQFVIDRRHEPGGVGVVRMHHNAGSEMEIASPWIG